MSTTRKDQLPTLVGTPAQNDLVLVVAGGVTSRITVANLLKSLTALAPYSGSTTDRTKVIPVTVGGVAKKATLDTLLSQYAAAVTPHGNKVWWGAAEPDLLSNTSTWGMARHGSSATTFTDVAATSTSARRQRLATSTTINNRCYSCFEMASGVQHNFARAAYVGFKAKMISSTNMRYAVGFCDTNSLWAADLPTSAIGFAGLRYESSRDGNWHLLNSNDLAGGSHAYTYQATGIALDSSAYHFYEVFYTGGRTYAFIDGVSCGSLATNFPTNGNIAAAGIWAMTAETVAKEIEWETGYAAFTIF